jgi:hypothetical protein
MLSLARFLAFPLLISLLPNPPFAGEPARHARVVSNIPKENEIRSRAQAPAQALPSESKARIAMMLSSILGRLQSKTGPWPQFLTIRRSIFRAFSKACATIPGCFGLIRPQRTELYTFRL